MKICAGEMCIRDSIKRLREKINDHEHWRIATIWGIGYKFETK